jgi:hypothetical protein
VNFAPIIQNNSSTAIGHILVDNNRINISAVSPTINGISDQDAKILVIKNIYEKINKFPLTQRITLIDNETIVNFRTLQRNKTQTNWESVYLDRGRNYMFY